MTEKKWVVAPEAAEAEFERFTDAWRIDTDMSGLDEEGAQSFHSTKRRLMVAIQRGVLTVDESGETLVLTLEFPNDNGVDRLTMKPATGAALKKWDRFKERQQVEKINATMGDVCKCSPAVFTQMDLRDLKTVQAVTTLFLVG